MAESPCADGYASATRCRPHLVPAERAGLARRLLYSGLAMPKMKTHSGAKKRFKLTAKGKVRGPALVHEPHPREEVAQAQAPARPSVRDLASTTSKRVKTLLGAKRS